MSAPEEAAPRPLVMIPELCSVHALLAVQAMTLGESDPWRDGLAVASVLLFQRVVALPKVAEACGGDIARLPIVYPVCWGCTFPASWDHVSRILVKGLAHAHAMVNDPIVAAAE